MRSPLERYRFDIENNNFQYDAIQEQAVTRLNALFEKLIERDNELKNSHSVKEFFKKLSRKKVEPLEGLYFWGGVGRGKTYIMDTFFNALPLERKMRIHFHRFMQTVHQQLTKLAGEKNPLKIVARSIAEDTLVICFDEFFVSDIGDAMILATLMEELFDQGVTLVATSNIEPNGLYKDGLQRARFLPAIQLINRYTHVMNIDSGIDYRLRTLEQAQLYYSPLGEESDQGLLDRFNSLCPDSSTHQKGQVIDILGRPLTSIICHEDVVWFDFYEMCDGPRSANDYIELARLFHTVIISGVPQMGGENDDMARRFINMIDEFYDRHVKLIVSAAVPLSELYVKGRLNFEFERTNSRLLEMQSQDYLALEHLS